VAIQADGKIVVVGIGGAGDDFALARYNPNGSLDTSFSGDGKQTIDFGGFDAASGVAIQANGRIIAVGRGSGDFALARYNPNGSLDTSFSGDGRQLTDFGGNDAAYGVALEAQGKMVALGRGSGDFALARYNPNGSLDASFSGDGRQITDFGSFDEGRGVALGGNGKIVTVGDAGIGDFALARYNPNGSLDPSFSADGKRTTDFGGDDAAYGMALQTDGKIVAVGGGGTAQSGVPLHGSGEYFALARYNPNGSLDPSFSGDGRQRTDFGGSDRASGVALQTDGKIVVVGNGGAGDDFALARYNPNGSLDPSFSGDGRQTTDFGGGDAAHGMALQANGKIVAIGHGLGSDQLQDFALVRYLGS
jgi:uncharacterized delta-60 repeat protein